jgi:hypothetical protein
MSKPWLETWGYIAAGAEFGGIVFDRSQARIVRPTRDEPGTWADVADKEDLAFAAAAPDMCRALLAIEWQGGEFCAYQCPRCRVFECSDDPTFHGKHIEDCALDAALTKAGLPDQASRDAARKEIGL